MDQFEAEPTGSGDSILTDRSDSIINHANEESFECIASSIEVSDSIPTPSKQHVSDSPQNEGGQQHLDQANDRNSTKSHSKVPDLDLPMDISGEPDLLAEDLTPRGLLPTIIDLTLDDDEDNTITQLPKFPSRSRSPKKEDESDKHDFFHIPSFDEATERTSTHDWQATSPSIANTLGRGHEAVLFGEQLKSPQEPENQEHSIFDITGDLVDDDEMQQQDGNQFMANLLHQYLENTQVNRIQEKSQLPPSLDWQVRDLEDPGSDDNEADQRAELCYEAKKKAYDEKKASGSLTNDDEICFLRAQAAEQQRLGLRKRQKDFDFRHIQDEAAEQNTLFLPEGPTSVDDDVPMFMDTVIDQADEDIRPLSPIEISDDDRKQKRKKGRPNGSKTRGTLKSVAGKSRVGKSTKSGTTAKRGQGRSKKGNHGFDMNGIRNLFHNDIIGQAQANQNQAAQPVLGGGKNKQKALLDLIASLPEKEQDLNRGDKVKLLNASKLFASRGAMKTDGDQGWKLKGMKSRLHHFQMLGASWMREREMKGKPNGGILGDTMGFGKTVISLANIVDGRPPDTWRGAKATLIVAPSNLLSQWLGEIAKHVEDTTFKDIIVYRAGSRLISANPARTLGEQDIVITSYHEVSRSMPRNEPPSSLVTAQAKEEWWQKYYKENKGPLHQVYWYRIVLDEAQAIKNYKSITSEAARALPGKFRWCLTATPIQNSLEEFYPYMNFLREEHAGRCSFHLFKTNYCRLGSQKAIQRLQVTLDKVMLRRTHEAKLFNRPVVQLPPIAPVKTTEVKFNVVERAIYNIVNQRFMEKLVGHPLLIQKSLQELLEREDIEKLWLLTKQYAEPTQTTGMIDNNDGSRDTAEALRNALVYAKKNENAVGPHADEHDNELSINFRKYLQSLLDDGQWAQASERSLCHACGNPPDKPHLTPCMHLYCLGCLNDLWFTELHQGGNMATCMECGTIFDKVNAYQAKTFDEASGNGNPTHRKGPDASDENIDWFNVPGPILRSAKIKGAVRQLKLWFDQDETNKIIIFVQFRGLIKILERVLQEEKRQYVVFDGSMSFDARDEAISLFSAPKSKYQILLAGLKAGGIGLNLTAANRVMILDLWWNESIESQAFCRAYRIGQVRDVEVVRFVVKDSIDTDILKMQERKTKEIDKAMQEKNRPKLSVQELMDLFTDQVEDDNLESESNELPFVFTDDPYQTNDVDMDDEVEVIGTNPAP